MISSAAVDDPLTAVGAERRAYVLTGLESSTHSLAYTNPGVASFQLRTRKRNSVAGFSPSAVQVVPETILLASFSWHLAFSQLFDEARRFCTLYPVAPATASHVKVIAWVFTVAARKLVGAAGCAAVFAAADTCTGSEAVGIGFFPSPHADKSRLAATAVANPLKEAMNFRIVSIGAYSLYKSPVPIGTVPTSNWK